MKNKKFRLWGLKNNRGRVIATFETKFDATFDSIGYQSKHFKTKFWKKYPESWHELRRKGWSVVKGWFEEEKHERD